MTKSIILIKNVTTLHNLNSNNAKRNIKEEKEKKVLELLDSIKQEFNISSYEILNLLSNEENTFPIEIFSERKLSLLQAAVKYLKENKNYSNKKIAEALTKDQRSIWLAYSKAKTRKKENFVIKKSESNIPFSIFQNKDSLLGPLIDYLKSLGWSNRKIANRLNRSETTISTMYRRSLRQNGK